MNKYEISITRYFYEVATFEVIAENMDEAKIAVYEQNDILNTECFVDEENPLSHYKDKITRITKIS